MGAVLRQFGSRIAPFALSRTGSQHYAAAAGVGKQTVFDRLRKECHRDRAAAQREPVTNPLLEEVTSRLLDRLDDCTRKFPVAVNLGGAGDIVARQLALKDVGVETLYQLDISHGMLKCSQEASAEVPRMPTTHYVQMTEENLPLKEASVDVIISSLGLHWVNDLPGAMAQCRRALKPDGLFIAAVLGGETLQELRVACAISEMEREGGVSARISPFVQMRDAGNLLGMSGFTLPAVDTDEIQINYPNILELVSHLRMMGETNSSDSLQRALRRDTALATAAVYQSMEMDDGHSNEVGKVSIDATFQVVYMTGWSPHPSQQKARQPGSATTPLSDLESIGKLHDVDDVTRT